MPNSTARPKTIALLFSIMLLSLTSCTTFMATERVKVTFKPVDSLLSYKLIKPDDSLKNGVLLRLKPQKKMAYYVDDVEMYSQISDDSTGVRVFLEKCRDVFFEKGPLDDSFYKTIITKMVKNNEKRGEEKILLNSRGKILKFVKGKFFSKRGELTFLSHCRTSMYPEKKVKPGDRWSYMESMDVLLDTPFFSKKPNTPQVINVNCVLKGFAIINSRKCAVITTTTFSRRSDTYSSFFKDITVETTIFADETIFFDFEKGIILASITKTDSTSTSENGDFADISKSRIVSVLKTPPAPEKTTK